MKGARFTHEQLRLIFNAVAIPGLASPAGVSVLYVSLHNADPAGADQARRETLYKGYQRIGLARSEAGWKVTGNSVSPVAPVDFAECEEGADSITHWAVGIAATGAGKLLYSGPLQNGIDVKPGYIPRLKPDSTITEE
jgi:hypothetical protein